MRITLTNDEDILDAIGKLRSVYHNLMRLDYDNKRTSMTSEIEDANVDEKSPFELFAQLYEAQNNQEMNEEQSSFIKQLIEKYEVEKELADPIISNVKERAY